MSQVSVSAAPPSRQQDLLPLLIQLFFVLAPLEILMVYAGGTELTAGMIFGGGLGTMGLLLILSSHLGLSWRADRPIVYMLLFVCAGAVSTAMTIYGAPAIQKGVVNLSAIFAMILMALVVKQASIQWPTLFPHLVRITAVATGIAGLTAIYQSFVWNLLGMPQLFDLSFLNSFWGQTWWRPAIQGGLIRAQGIFAEPSFLAAYVGMASGLAMARLGILGSTWRGYIRDIVPSWAAVSILASIILSFSAVAYAGLLAAFFGAMVSKITFSFRSIMFFVIGSVAAIVAIVLFALQAREVIVERVTDLAVFSQLGRIESGTTFEGDRNLSVLILFLNSYVTLQNVTANPLLGAGVGAHPFAYEAILPPLPMLPGSAKGAMGVNSQDASALLLRLLSETGALGTAIFSAAVLSAWLRLRKVVRARDLEMSAGGQSLRAVALGLGGSLVGVFAAMLLHIPHYYAPEFWGLFALCTTLPALAGRSLPRGEYLQQQTV